MHLARDTIGQMCGHTLYLQAFVSSQIAARYTANASSCTLTRDCLSHVCFLERVEELLAVACCCCLLSLSVSLSVARLNSTGLDVSAGCTYADIK